MTGTRIIPNQESNRELQLASDTQQAKIRALNTEIAALVLDINRPYSTIISATTIPAIIGTLFLWKSSPFHPYYQSFENRAKNAVQDYLNPIITATSEMHHTLLEEFERLSNELVRIYLENRPNKTPEEMLNGIIDAIDKNHIRVGHLKNVELFKKYFITIHNRALLELEAGATNDNDLFDHSAPYKYTFRELYYKTRALLVIYNKHAPELLQQAIALTNTLSTDTARMFANISFAITKVAFAMPGQYLVIDRILQRYFPYGICQSASPTNRHVTELEAAKTIQSLLNFKTSLYKKARRNIIAARIFSFFVCPLVTYLLANIENPTPELIIIAISLAGTALKDALKDSQALWQNCSLSSDLKKAEKNIKTLLLHNHEALCVRGRTLAASHFSIHFKRVNGCSLSPENLATLFVDSLEHHKINVIAHHDNNVILAANFVKLDSYFHSGYKQCLRKVKLLTSEKSNETITQLQLTFQGCIEHQEAILILKGQVRKFLHIILESPEFICKKSFDDKTSFPEVVIEFNLPIWMKDYSTDISDLFSSNNIRIYENNELLNIMITGATSLKALALDRLAAKIKTQVRQRILNQEEKLRNEKLQIIQPKNTTNTLSYYVQKQKTSNSDSKSDTKMGSQEEKEKYHEKPFNFAAKFNLSVSEEKNAPVYPINNAKVRDYQSYVNSNHLIRNLLDINKTPTDLYDAVQKCTEDAKFVARENEQGWVLWKAKGKDQMGATFVSSLKLKLLGKRFGNLSVKAKHRSGPDGQPLRGPNGELLHEVVGILVKSHKKQGKEFRAARKY